MVSFASIDHASFGIHTGIERTMSELTTIKSRSKTGQVIEMQVSEILEINGKPYRSADYNENILQHVNYLSGRVAALESILRQPQRGE